MNNTFNQNQQYTSYTQHEFQRGNPNNSKQCKYCRQPIDPKAKVCPYCQKKQSGIGNVLKAVIIALALIIFVPAFIGACSSNSKKTGSSSSNPTPPVQQTTKEQKSDNLNSSKTKEESEKITEAEKQDTSVSITGHHLTKNYADEDVLVIDYAFYNGEDEPKSFSWTFDDKCYQNGIECSSYVSVDEVDSQKQIADVQPGVTLNLSVAYKLDDLSEVNVVVKRYLSDKVYLDETFSP